MRGSISPRMDITGHNLKFFLNQVDSSRRCWGLLIVGFLSFVGPGGCVQAGADTSVDGYKYTREGD